MFLLLCCCFIVVVREVPCIELDLFWVRIRIRIMTRWRGISAWFQSSGFGVRIITDRVMPFGTVCTCRFLAGSRNIDGNRTATFSLYKYKICLCYLLKGVTWWKLRASKRWWDSSELCAVRHAARSNLIFIFLRECLAVNRFGVSPSGSDRGHLLLRLHQCSFVLSVASSTATYYCGH
jgi:hypothetical protein